MDVRCETALRAVRDGLIGGSLRMVFCQGLFDVLRNGKGIIGREHIASGQQKINLVLGG